MKSKIALVVFILIALPLFAKEPVKCPAKNDTNRQTLKERSRRKLPSNQQSPCPETVLDPAHYIETNIRKLRRFQLNLKAKKTQINLIRPLLRIQR